MDNDDLINEDWIKSQSWDFDDDAGQVDTLPRFIAISGLLFAPLDTQVAFVKEFLDLPAALGMPDQLSQEIAHWLRHPVAVVAGENGPELNPHSGAA